MDFQVILKSRGNPLGLTSALYALTSLQSDTQLIDYTVILDDDDLESQEAAEKAADVLNWYKTVAVDIRLKPAEYNLYKFMNELAAEGDAEMCMVWDDDVLPLTKSWDAKVMQISSPLFGWEWGKNPNAFCYGCYTRFWRQACGYIHSERFPFWFADAWGAEVFHMAMGFGVPIIEHLKLDGRRGNTRGLRDLEFWFEYYKATRVLRVAEAERIRGGAVDDVDIVAFSEIDKIHKDNIANILKFHSPPPEPPSARYDAAYADAKAWMAEYAECVCS